VDLLFSFEVWPRVLLSHAVSRGEELWQPDQIGSHCQDELEAKACRSAQHRAGKTADGRCSQRALRLRSSPRRALRPSLCIRGPCGAENLKTPSSGTSARCAAFGRRLMRPCTAPAQPGRPVMPAIRGGRPNERGQHHDAAQGGGEKAGADQGRDPHREQMAIDGIAHPFVRRGAPRCVISPA
jgi:hypothetical protein